MTIQSTNGLSINLKYEREEALAADPLLSKIERVFATVKEHSIQFLCSHRKEEFPVNLDPSSAKFIAQLIENSDSRFKLSHDGTQFILEQMPSPAIPGTLEAIQELSENESEVILLDLPWGQNISYKKLMDTFSKLLDNSAERECLKRVILDEIKENSLFHTGGVFWKIAALACCHDKEIVRDVYFSFERYLKLDSVPRLESLQAFREFIAYLGERYQWIEMDHWWNLLEALVVNFSNVHDALENNDRTLEQLKLVNSILNLILQCDFKLEQQDKQRIGQCFKRLQSWQDDVSHLAHNGEQALIRLHDRRTKQEKVRTRIREFILGFFQLVGLRASQTGFGISITSDLGGMARMEAASQPEPVREGWFDEVQKLRKVFVSFSGVEQSKVEFKKLKNSNHLLFTFIDGLKERFFCAADEAEKKEILILYKTIFQNYKEWGKFQESRKLVITVLLRLAKETTGQEQLEAKKILKQIYKYVLGKPVRKSSQSRRILKKVFRIAFGKQIKFADRVRIKTAINAMDSVSPPALPHLDTFLQKNTFKLPRWDEASSQLESPINC